MGKIFEALEKARREREGLKSPPMIVVLPPGERPGGEIRFPAEGAMVALARNIDSFLETSPRKVIQFIGSQAGEGTSTIIRDFAMFSAGRLRKSVLLLDTDHRNPSQCEFFRVSSKFGWEEIVHDKGTFEKAISKIGDIDLYVYSPSPSSPSTPNVLYSSGIKEFWEEMKQLFDLVLIDSAPAATSPDGITLSRYVDGVVLVLEAEKTRKPVAESLKNQILQNGGNLLGMVFNNRRYHIPEFVYRRL
jgi:capsular exopolysaccharide synthesis family protein